MRLFHYAAGLTAVLLVTSVPVSANALGCIDDQLDESQRAAIGSLFAEQTDDPTAPRILASGSAAASGDFANVIGGCADRLSWSGPQRALAEHYLIRLGALSQTGTGQSDNWRTAMEAYAPFGARLLVMETDDDGDGDGDETVSKHSRAMIAAGAHANGVPAGADDEADNSPITAYLLNYLKLEQARAAFNAAT